jgi:hypothetical protein
MRCARAAHNFVVVTLSNGVQVHPQPAAREAFMRRVGAIDLFYPDRRLKSLGDREDFPVIMLAPALSNTRNNIKFSSTALTGTSATGIGTPTATASRANCSRRNSVRSSKKARINFLPAARGNRRWCSSCRGS